MCSLNTIENFSFFFIIATVHEWILKEIILIGNYIYAININEYFNVMLPYCHRVFQKCL